jgi:prefoldin subunit 5
MEQALAAIIAEHTRQVQELTQRIGELCRMVNERDAVIEKIRAALRQDYSD